jgi:predicted 3-demethylubiquinone-9 3-methyltransferase (glyoxalase superfamily)
MQKITPFLWFDNNAEEAVNFYVSIFKNSKIIQVKRYPEGMDDPHVKDMGGKVLTAVFELDGEQFMAMDAGPIFKFNEAISMMVDCESQEEVDYYWEKLTAEGGEESVCGWLKDKYGLSWQITPRILPKLITDPDQEKGRRVMQAMMKMKKIVIKDLEDAYNQN